MSIREYLREKKVICDGAFGTYFADKYGVNTLPESFNCSHAGWMKQIHKEYLEAGAVLIRTNTFAANRRLLGCDTQELKENIRAAYQNALEAVKEAGRRSGVDCFIAGDIGPVQGGAAGSGEASEKEYRLICDALLEAGADILLFETFADIDDILPVIRDIRKEHEVFVIVQFCVNQHGYSNAGISAKRLLWEAAQTNVIDAAGFNCGVGPGHLYRILKQLEYPDNIYLTALPNAGYPKYIQNRRVFDDNEEYFADKLNEIGKLGASFLGGCCGTSPSYIQQISHRADIRAAAQHSHAAVEAPSEKHIENDRGFWCNKKAGEKLIAVELSPPPGADDEKVMEAAFRLKKQKVDAVTFPDSPSGRTRADSVLMALKVQHETGLCVMPHICCRDKNAIAMRSQLLGAYLNGIRNMLVITGDPVPTLMRQDIKSVFNFDSVGLMKIIDELNQEEFAGEPLRFGGALNPNRRNLDVEIKRVGKKLEQGAEFFLTQPIFTREDAQRLKMIKEQTKARILCGIMPLVSYRNALFIKNEMAGIHVDDEILAYFTPDMNREEGENAGVEIAKRVMEYTKEFADGYYFSIPFNRVYLLDQILEKDS